MTMGKRIVWEMRIALGCLLAALGLNIYAIAAYKTQWSELYTTWNITLAIAVAVYLLIAALRIVVALLRWLFFRKTW
jgi:hypothetical protein